MIIIVKNSQNFHCCNASTNGVVFSDFWVSFLVSDLAVGVVIIKSKNNFDAFRVEMSFGLE